MSLFAPDQFRTSDHDPVVVGLRLDGKVDALAVAVPILLWPANHTLRNVTVVAVDRRLRQQRVDILATTSSELDSGLGKGDLPGDIVPVDHDTVKLRAERFGRFGRTYTIKVIVTKNHQAVVESTPVFVLPSLFGSFGADGSTDLDAGPGQPKRLTRSWPIAASLSGAYAGITACVTPSSTRRSTTP